MKKSKIVSIVLTVTLVSLLSGVEARTPLGKWKLIYLFVIPLTIYILAATPPRYIRVSYGLILLIPFYLVSTVPILWNENDGLYILRRFVQIFTLFCFGLSLCNVDVCSLRRSHFLLALSLVTCILAFNIAWHVSHGYYTGWKRLGDPKAAFLFLPMCLAAGMVLHALPNTKKWLALWGILCIIILLSGERKAIVSFCLVIFVLFIKLKTSTFAAPAVVLGLIILALGPLDAFTSGYINKQVGSILFRHDPQNELWYILKGGLPASMSDAARQLSEQVAWKLFSESPLFGVGLDGTVEFTNVYLANYPEYLRIAVHNEFLRVLAENGLFGFFFFLLPLVRSVLLSMLDAIRFYRLFNDNFYLCLVLIIFIPSFTYMWSEGSGTEMFALVVIVALLPDLLPQIALQSRIGVMKRVSGTEQQKRRVPSVNFPRE